MSTAIEKPAMTIPEPGTRIGMREAERKYGMSHQTISNWAERGLIKVIEGGSPGLPTLVDERDVVLVALLHYGPRSGRPFRAGTLEGVGLAH